MGTHHEEPSDIKQLFSYPGQGRGGKEFVSPSHFDHLSKQQVLSILTGFFSGCIPAVMNLLKRMLLAGLAVLDIAVTLFDRVCTRADSLFTSSAVGTPN